MLSLLSFRGGKTVGMGAGSTLISLCAVASAFSGRHTYTHVIRITSLPCSAYATRNRSLLYIVFTHAHTNPTHTHATVYTCPLSLRLLSTQNLPPLPSPLPLLSSTPRIQPPSPVKPEAPPVPPSSGLMRKQEVWRCPPFSARKKVSHCRVRSVRFRIGC